MSRLSKEIFRNTSLSSVILPYYSDPLSARKMMLRLSKKSRWIWLENNSQWSHLLTNLRTNVNILSCRTAIKHVKYLAKISPFALLDFSIDFGALEDIKFIKKLLSLIENKKLSKLNVNMSYPENKNNEWESEAKIKSVMSIINLIPEVCEKYEINIVGKRIQVTELPDCIKFRGEAIFGENQWIISQESARFARLLGEYNQIWKEIGVGDLDLEIINEIKSPDDIKVFKFYMDEENFDCRTLLDFNSMLLSQRHKYECVFLLVYADWISFDKPDKDTNKIYNIYPLIKTFLPKMRSLKIIDFFDYYENIFETIKQLDLKSLQQNGVKINFYSSNSS